MIFSLQVEDKMIGQDFRRFVSSDDADRLIALAKDGVDLSRIEWANPHHG